LTFLFGFPVPVLFFELEFKRRQCAFCFFVFVFSFCQIKETENRFGRAVLSMKISGNTKRKPKSTSNSLPKKRQKMKRKVTAKREKEKAADKRRREQERSAKTTEDDDGQQEQQQQQQQQKEEKDDDDGIPDAWGPCQRSMEMQRLTREAQRKHKREVADKRAAAIIAAFKQEYFPATSAGKFSCSFSVHPENEDVLAVLNILRTKFVRKSYQVVYKKAEAAIEISWQYAEANRAIRTFDTFDPSCGCQTYKHIPKPVLVEPKPMDVATADLQEHGIRENHDEQQRHSELYAIALKEQWEQNMTREEYEDWRREWHPKLCCEKRHASRIAMLN
jgi:hypothetical protein